MELEKTLLRKVGEAVTRFKMIRDGDRVAVALSGGKDSATMLEALLLLQKRAPIDFSIRTFTVEQGKFLSSIEPMGEYLKQRGYKVDLAISDALNPQKLLRNHIDFWATGDLLGKYLIGKAGLTDQIVPLFKFELSELYMACNRAMDPQRAEEFNRILQEMDSDGSSAAIERKYQ